MFIIIFFRAMILKQLLFLWRIMKRILLILCMLASVIDAVAVFQPSESTEISVLVCSPGNDMYSQYGHAAMHVRDTTQRVDEVFDYGVFYIYDYVDFVRNFLTGKMFYSVEAQPFQLTRWIYASEGRGITEYKLNLTLSEKKCFCAYLLWNLRTANKEYLYNFFEDNCATKLRDIIERFVPQVQWNEPYAPDTWKNVVFKYSDKNSWCGLGIQLALGLPADKNATPRGMMFSPEHLAKSLMTATVGDRKLVTQTREVLPVMSVAQHPLWENACLILWIVAVLILLLSLWELKTRKRVIWFDVLLFFVIGVLGTVISYIMCFSVHSLVFPNFNLLWMLPTHVFFAIAWAVRPWREKLKWYFVFTAAMVMVSVVLSFEFGQQIYASTWALLFIFVVRSVYFLRKE